MVVIFRPVIYTWWWLQRQIDLALIWPACKMKAPDIGMARRAFAYHAYREPCWVKRFGPEELARIIADLR